MHGLKERNLHMHFVVTATTRPRREEETQGVDYFFVSKDEFARMIEQEELIEYAIVYNDYKGIPKQQVRDALASGPGCDHARGCAGRHHRSKTGTGSGAHLPDHRERGLHWSDG